MEDQLLLFQLYDARPRGSQRLAVSPVLAASKQRMVSWVVYADARARSQRSRSRLLMPEIWTRR